MNTKNIRQTNRLKVIDSMKGKYSRTKSQISDFTELSLASVNTIIDELLQEGQITELGYNKSTGGRRSKSYQLLATYTKILCFSILRNDYRVTIVYHIYDLHDQLVESKTIIKKRVNLEDIRTIIDTVLLIHPNVKVISFSTPGIIESGFLSCTGIEGFTDLPLEDLMKHYKQRFAFVNDVNSAALGFSILHPQYPNSSFLFMPETLFAGIGSVVDGKLLVGKTNIAGEAQYLPFSNQKSREEMMLNRQGSLELATYYIRILISILNPDVVAVCCTMFEDCQVIRDMLLSTFQENDIPELVKVEYIFDFVMLGTLEMAKRELKTEE
ncbi:hypothetical protein [Tannockella kyphosi]|uniref:hypothetical protein n=1 Tax=Tannockella kyphosi TaxID=2899121 RepID=UPI002011B7C1|nr:hypothetical protein [Tannockella kyphosi]